MSRGPYSIVLMLAMSLPSAVRALGLGDIRVDSALNEPLSAQIDIVGATRDELAGLAAKVANHEVFQRYGADRPAFLSSATFKVGLDAQGRPVLNVRSADPFTDPVISFLVDLRWGRNEIVREYSLLLDPAGFNATPTVALASNGSAPRSLPAAPAAGTAAVAASAVRLLPAGTADAGAAPAIARVGDSATELDRSGHARYTVVAGDTLRSIVRRAGARSESQMQRMMLAVLRANPGAFEGNINRMHRGSVLKLPDVAAVAAISEVDAKREVRAQMTAWRLEGRPVTAHAAPVRQTPAVAVAQADRAVSAAHTVAAVPAAPSVSAAPPVSAASHGSAAPVVLAAPTAASRSAQAISAVPVAAAATPMAAPARAATDQESPNAALQSRVQFLERALDDMHKQLASEGANIQDLKEAAARGPVVVRQPGPATASPQPVLAAVTQSPPGGAFLGPMALALGILLAGFAFIRKKINSRVPASPAEAVLANTDTGAEVAAHEIAAPPAAASRMTAAAPSARPVEAPSVVAAAPKRTDFVRSIAADIPPKASNETTVSLEVDAEALERSYLDSLGAEATLDTVGVSTVAVDASELGADLMNAELDTMVLDMKNAADKVADNGRANAPQLTDLELDDTGLDYTLDGAGLTDQEPAGVQRAATNQLQTVAAGTELDYNLLDLDATAQHVHMPSDLHDRAQTSERRTNIVDVLKVAIEQDPHRRDLRMKLLETYYSAASTNQRAFLEVVRQLNLEREHLSDDDWKKVTMMGRDIAPTDPLFNELLKDDGELAHCA